MNNRLLVDIDGVIVLPHAYVVDWIQNHPDSDKRDPEFKLEDITDWGFGGRIKELGITREECLEVYHETGWRKNWQFLKYTDEFVPEALQLISKRWYTDLVTANPMDGVQKLVTRRNLSHDIFMIHNSCHKTNLDYPVLVEDNPTLVDQLQRGQYLFLRRQPWNQDIPKSDYVWPFYHSSELPIMLLKLQELGVITRKS